ncbi:MAG: filamentous hemagglutinin N-terminal domain-containing protein [Planctomycetota bacterium]|jgi:filamentous hemagglutinin family protein
MKTLNSVPYRSIAHRFVIYLLVFCIVNIPVWAISGHDLVGGSANFTPGNNYLVDLLSNRAVINWDNFNTSSTQGITFTGPVDFAVLNRTMSAVNFDGFLDAANGHVLLVSPSGIVFGSKARISAKSFIASGLDISNTEFMNMSHSDLLARKYNFVPFEIDGVKMIGAVTNNGLIGYDKNGNPTPVEFAALIGSKVLNNGTILADGEMVVLASGDEISLSTVGSEINVVLYNTPVAVDTYNVINDTAGSVKNQNSAGTIVLAAGDTFAQAVAGIQDKAYMANTYTASQRGTLDADTLEVGAANQADFRAGSKTTSREIKIGAKKVLIEETLQSSGTMIIDADYDINALEGLKSIQDMELRAGRHVQAKEDIISEAKAKIQTAIQHAEGKLSSRGNIVAEEGLLLIAESVLWGDSHQTIRSETSVKSTGSISKITAGNLNISAVDDVQLDGNVSAVKGGVSVISEAGKIHTGDGSDTLNVAISGYSDEITDSIGVELPDGEGKAAIVLKSHDTIKLGSDAALKAEGFYLSAEDDPDNGVDNRPDITFLDTDGTEIGGWERDEGIASDVAIYVGSETGNVNVKTTKIETPQPGEMEYGEGEKEIYSGPATVVFDSQDTVTMPTIGNIQQGRNNNENDNLFRFRLEVVTRITEWLSQAVKGNKLPYAGNPEAVEAVTGEDYVLRGAGLDNPQITDGRIWVLEDPPKTPPKRRRSPQLSVAPVAPLPEQELPELVGCPAEMEAAALELEINTGELQLKIQNSMATNPNIQPCDACARLLIAAGALQDRDGERYAAMVEIFNTLAPLDAPFTPEVSASINTLFADLADKDPQYAIAADYIDSFVDYIAVLNHDLKTPVGDATVYTLNKYGEAIMSNPNQNIITYLVEQLETENISL